MNGKATLTDGAGYPHDVVYFPFQPSSSLEESYSFLYMGPTSIVEPFLVNAVDTRRFRGYGINLTESAPDNKNAGDVFYEHIISATGSPRRTVRGRLRTVPYFYSLGHTYRVDVLVNSSSHLITARVYDTALGPQTFDHSIMVIDSSARFYPGLMNELGGRIAVNDFAFGSSGSLPVYPHAVRRAYDYINYLGYNAGVSGSDSSPESIAFQRYFPRLAIRHVRVSADVNSSPSLNAVARYNIDADVLTGRGTTIGSLRSFIDKLALRPDSIELWNEPNNRGQGAAYDPHFADTLPSFARSVKAALPQEVIWGPSILPVGVYPTVAQQMAGPLHSLISGWNTHPYAPRNPETTGFGRFVSGACGVSMKEDCGWYGSATWNNNESAVIDPLLPGMASEGAASYGSYPELCGHGNVSMGAQQAYIQRGMLYGFKLGYRRIYPYKFIDDPTCSDGFGKFGILSRIVAADGSIAIAPKPAYTALVYLDSLLNDVGAGAASFEPAPLSYALGNAPPDLEELVLGASDGSYRLILWSDNSLWDFDANGGHAMGRAIPASSTDVVVKLADPSFVETLTQSHENGVWQRTSMQVSALTVAVTVDQFPLVLYIRPRRSTGEREGLMLPTSVPTPSPTNPPEKPKAS